MDILDGAIDPFLGSDEPGNCLPGPYLPFSLIRLGPDVEIPQPSHGYRSTGRLLRFSHTHVSGTGGMGRYGNVGLMPFLAESLPEGVDSEWGMGLCQDREDETASAGAYAVILRPSGIRVELTSTPHCGLHRLTYPGWAAGLYVDATAIITTSLEVPDNDPNGFAPRVRGGWMHFPSPHSAEGEVELEGGWGHGSPYRIAFAMEFSHPVIERRDGPVPPGATTPLVSALRFDTQVLEVRAGMSTATVERARQSLVEEAQSSFDTIRTQARDTWHRALAAFPVTGGTPEQRTLFATSIYRLLCMPTDLGSAREFVAWPTSKRHFSDFYCLWDSCRNANSYLAILDPQTHADMVNCLLDVGEQTGWTPDAWIAGDSAFRQGGNSLDILLGEAAAKDLPGIDWARAWAVAQQQLSAISPDPYRFGRHPHGPEGRYLPAEVPQSVSRTLEYRYQEWCLASLAERAGDLEAADALRAASRDVWELWRSDLRAFAPRQADGRWVEPFSPDHHVRDSWTDPACYEGSSRQWSWNVLHDLPGLVTRLGGLEAAARALEEFLEGSAEVPELPGLVRAAAYHPKETMIHVPFLLHEVGQPGRGSWWVRRILDRYYRVDRQGLPDNEDMGCQSAFVIGACLGISPVMGQDRYWLTAPAFSHSQLPSGLQVVAPGAGPDTPWLVGAVLNGQRLRYATLRHRDLSAGELVLEVASEPGPWRGV